MGKEEWKRLYNENGVLIYEGYTFHDKPCGTGTTYYPSRRIYQEGKFGVKGFLGGKEYYPNGTLRFEGEYSVCHGYGPNYPRRGFFQTRDGSFKYNGEFTIRFGGVGYPTVTHPKQFGSITQQVKIPVLMWADEKELKEISKDDDA